MRERTEHPARAPVRQRLAWTIAGFGTLAVAACLFAPLVGSTRIHLGTVFDRSIPYADNIDAQIFFVARLPRVLAALLVGSALALSGVVFQALLRNALASPDTLGVSAGASLGAMMAITFNFGFSLLGISAVSLASFAGSFGALAVVYGLSAARRRGTSAMVLLLGGVTVHALLSAVIAFVDGRGFPRMVPCWFVWWEDAFYTTSGVDKFHVRAIRKDPRGSFCVEVQEITPRRMSNRQVKGVGRFEVIDTDVAEWGARIRRKYLGSAGGRLLADAEGRVVLRLAPERLTAHGGDFMLSPGAGTP